MKMKTQTLDEKIRRSRAGSSSGVPDFLPYGATDKMSRSSSQIPEMVDEDRQSHTKGRTESVCSSISIQTWKSLHSRHTPNKRVTDDRPVRSSISSRARQIKDHEVDPFLSIDLMPGTTCNSRSSIKARPSLCISTNTLPSCPNIRVKMPFKHAVIKSDLETVKQKCVMPGQALTESTVWAVHLVNTMLNEQKPHQITYLPGRLLKARLKSLDPVYITEPTIHQCRGILAETRTYSASSSRIFQRLKSTLSVTHLQKDMPPTNKQPVSICESVHRTSEVSTPEPADASVFSRNGDFDQKMLLDTRARRDVF